VDWRQETEFVDWHSRVSVPSPSLPFRARCHSSYCRAGFLLRLFLRRLLLSLNCRALSKSLARGASRQRLAGWS